MILDKMKAVSLANSDLTTFIEEQAKGTAFYTQAWLALIERLYRCAVISLTVKNVEGKITGFLPLCFMESPLTGRRLVALPFSDLCPLLAADEVSANALIDQALGLAQEQKAKYLELRTGINDILAKRPEFVQGNLYVRWLMPLAGDPNSIWSGLRKPIQHQVKKSQKLGVQVRIAEKREDVAHFYRLHLQTRCKKHGMPAQPQRYFYELWDTFAPSGAMKLLLAEYQGTIIASMILLASGTTIRYAYGASDERYLHLAPNNLLMWMSLKLGCEKGYQTFDMGRTACDNEGLMEFKRRWGAIKEPLPYYYYPQMAGLASTSESSRKFQLLTASWRRLPLAVAGLLGGYLYKHLG